METYSMKRFMPCTGYTLYVPENKVFGGSPNRPKQVCSSNLRNRFHYATCPPPSSECPSDRIASTDFETSTGFIVDLFRNEGKEAKGGSRLLQLP